MSSSTPTRFLLDENVKVELAEFLSERGVDFKNAKKASEDRTLASISIAEGRSIVTNDSDFSKLCKGDVFGVVWLRLPQSNTALLIRLFGAMLDDNVRYANSLIILEPEKRHVSALPTRHPPCARLGLDG